MDAIVTSLWILGLTALVVLLLKPWPRAAGVLGMLGVVAGAARALTGAVPVLLRGQPELLDATLSLPGGQLALGLDPLTAWFVGLACGLAIPIAVAGQAAASARGAAPGRGSSTWALFSLLVATVVVLLCARNGLLFLLAWEAMTILSFLLIAARHERETVRRAALRFLIAAQIGGACLLLAMALLDGGSGRLEFAGFARAAAAAGPWRRAAVFALAVAGFGTKAGLLPFHSWLPRAYPEAESHVVAFFSGAMAKTGIYGLLRILSFLPADRGAYGLTLLLLGAATTVGGIAFALGQQSLRRSLAWSSIENLGFIAAAVGLWLLGEHTGHPGLATAALAGGLLHVLHHGLVKSLLFVAAGSVEDATGSTSIEELGGLLVRMPGTGTAFLIGSAALSSLPPLSGLVGEWLVLCAGIRAVAVFPQGLAVAVLLALLGLVVAAGLAAAAFLRLFAIVFLGQPRTEAAARAHDAPLPRQAAVLTLAGVSLGIGLFPRLVAHWVTPVTDQLVTGAGSPAALQDALFPLAQVGRVAAVVLALALSGAWVRRRLARGQSAPARVATWGCGYSLPGPRGQYTGASFSALLLRALRHLVRPRASEQLPGALFPVTVRHATEVPDRVETELWEPMFAAVGRRLEVVRRLQDGRLERYLFQIVLCLVAGLLWALAFGWLER